MSKKLLIKRLIRAFPLLLVATWAQAGFLGFPHTGANDISCYSCHNVLGNVEKYWNIIPHPPQGIDDTPANNLCWSCHNDIVAPFMKPHSSLTTDNGYGDWAIECRTCHEPHFHYQLTYGEEARLASGNITEITTTGIRSAGAEWVDDEFAGLVVFLKFANKSDSYRVTGNSSDTLSIAGPIDLPPITTGGTFIVIYGKLVRSQINTPNSGLKPVKLFRPTGQNSFADGDDVFDGVCQVCHTKTNHMRNDGLAPDQWHENVGGGGTAGLKCTEACHLHRNGFVHGGPGVSGGDATVCVRCHGHEAGTLYDPDATFPYTAGTQASQGRGTSIPHSTHTESSLGISPPSAGEDDKRGPGIYCSVCHNITSMPTFKSGTDSDGNGMITLEETDVCDDCHSPGGAYNGVNSTGDSVGAKQNWKTGGVYNADNSLKEGKEKWCSGCHDAQQSISNPVGLPATYAPNVVGDNSTYGFWATGHGKSINDCLECHDANKKHFDHEHRTYEIDETTGNVVNPWGDSYRLRTSNTVANEQLCLKCHDQGALKNEGGQTNFRKSGSRFTGGHGVHVWSNTLSGKLADTDYDGLLDSRPGCVTCHNVHGSKSYKMTRTGELASTPGTDDRTPGVDLLYLKPAPGPFSTATWRPTLTSAGAFEVFGWWKKNGGMGTGEYTIYHDGGSTTVSHSQHQTGGQWVSLGTYNFSAGTSGYVELSARLSTLLLIADKMGFDTDADGIPDIIMDDLDPEFSSVDEVNGGEWPVNRWSEGRAINYNEGYMTADGLADSTAGYARFGSATVGWNKGVGGNKICNTCHGAFIYPRTPFMGPKVINRFEERRWVLNDGAGIADVVVSVTDPDGDMAGGSVTIDVSSFGGGGAEVMTNNGDGTYSYQLPIPLGMPDRSYALPITAIDAAGNVGTNISSPVFVKSSANNIYLDNIDAIHSFSDNWLRDIPSGNAYRGSYITTWNHRHVADESLVTATWKSPIKIAGNYNVYAWLQKSTIWNQEAVYTIQHSGGETPVAINQNTGATGGGWLLIGTFPFDAGDAASVSLTGANFGLHRQLYVDAVKLELILEPTRGFSRK